MIYLRMIIVAMRLAGPDLLMPWRSPLLLWRMETYGITDQTGQLLHAEEITPKIFFQFLVMRRKAFLGFLRWAATT